MRIMNVLANDKDGGAETFYMRFGASMHKRGVEQLMVLAPHRGRQAYFEEHNTPYVCIDFNCARGLWGKWRLRQEIYRFKPDIIIAWLKPAARLLPRRCRAIKIGRVGGYYKGKNYRYCDYIVANSIPLKNFMKNQGFKDAAYIANFVTVGSALTTPPTRRRPTLFFHGRLHPQKGLDVLIDALPHIEADVQIAGAGALEAELRQRAVTNRVAEKIEFLGWQKDTWSQLSNAHVYVFPSRYEGTSNSLLEAMACGKPIVTTNAESVSWFLTHGENALLVDVDDAQQLAQAVNRLIADPMLARQLGENARQLYQERFNEHVICGQWLEFCEIALENRNASGKTSQTETNARQVTF